MKNRILTVVVAVLMLCGLSYAATINLNDDDPIQYITVNTSGQSIPVGAELHLWVSLDGAAFTNRGIIPTGVEQTIRQGVPGPSPIPNSIYLAYTNNYKIFTQYQLYISDLNRTDYGATSDTVSVTMATAVLPRGEAINVTLDK